MVDVVNHDTRSRMMAGIRGKDSKPELLVRRYLHGEGFRFRLHVKDLKGKPDIVLRKWKAVIFVHGCFWHRHTGCRYTTSPATRTEFWHSKFEGNIERDRQTVVTLENDGWRVATVWECGLRGDHADTSCRELIRWLTSANASQFETSLLFPLKV